MPAISRFSVSLVSALLLVLAASASAPALEFAPAPGWEKDGVYDRHYNPAKHETLKGELLGYEKIRPLPGMSPGLAAKLRTRDGKTVTAHLGPETYVGFLPEVIHPGANLKLKGAFATIADQSVFMASKVRNAEIFELKLRSTSHGAPYWDLDRAEMIEETLED
ncbi:hypothetical protein [Desulfocurvibacter africanus]|uniref:Magnetosome protein MamS/MamX domain-containing protein n=1 Tax=Desulfocurvibacter africanus subsp. africanus str. Walvis Bay TaxID=690850 RepID=F3YZW9_DESAF|nr:hypothetical protein [Desulfocurvibacter africanus]EGJ50924.1 hypothetical protein Desaf_2605 [Desulfocurvibacter africanus subsp. africanus str. Walvis Bay]